MTVLLLVDWSSTGGSCGALVVNSVVVDVWVAVAVEVAVDGWAATVAVVVVTVAAVVLAVEVESTIRELVGILTPFAFSAGNSSSWTPTGGAAAGLLVVYRSSTSGPSPEWFPSPDVRSLYSSSSFVDESPRFGPVSDTVIGNVDSASSSVVLVTLLQKWVICHCRIRLGPVVRPNLEAW